MSPRWLEMTPHVQVPFGARRRGFVGKMAISIPAGNGVYPTIVVES